MIRAIIEAIAGFFWWLGTESRQTRVKRADVAKRDRATDKAVEAGRKAIKAGDQEEVNRRLGRLRLALAVALLGVAGSGCLSARPERVLYIEPGDVAVRMEHAGRPGWWLSDDRFAMLLEMAERWDAHRKDSIR